jgi:CheY-like chemotaxis protein
MIVSVVHDEGRAESVGVDSYLTKPIDSADLIAHVEALLAEGSTRRHVLVADPDPRCARRCATPSPARAGSSSTVSDLSVARSRPDPVPTSSSPRPTRPSPSRLVDELRADPATARRRRRPLRVRYSCPEHARKILIVDDEAHIRALLEQTLEELEDEGVELLTAADGEAALALVAAERPDLLFLDVMMPKMNGYEVCRAVRSDLGLTDVTVVL